MMKQAGVGNSQEFRLLFFNRKSNEGFLAFFDTVGYN